MGSALSIRQALCALSVLVSLGTYAQVRSGGAGSGMDPTGNQPNPPDATGSPVSEAQASSNLIRREAIAAYDAGRYAEAGELFRIAAENGDARSAGTLALMYRFGPRMFSAGFAADTTLASFWAAKAAEARSRMTSEVAAARA